MTQAPASQALHTLGVVECASAIAAGELSPVDLVEALLDRIAAIDGEVQAWAYVDAAGARAAAAGLAAEAKAGRLRGPLHGVPVGIKDVFDVAGMPTVSNSRTTSTAPVARDSSVARNLRAAGAIILGKTHTVEFAGMGASPPSRNPWNLAHTPGGSSSGSGAAVGARMVPAAIGTQTGGSNLRPAAYCGVSGFKGTYGRIGRYGCIPVSWSFDHPGVIARSIADCAAVFAACAGPDPADPTTLQEPAPPATPGTFPRPPRLGIVRDFFFGRAEPVMRDALEARAALLERTGAAVVEVSLPPEFWWHLGGHRLTMTPEAAVVHAKRYATRLPDLTPRQRAGIEAYSLVPATYYLQAQRVRRYLHERLQGLFADIDALIMPTAPGPAPAGLQSTGDASLLTPWTFIGYPAATVPAGLTPDGMPLGMQVVGPPSADVRVLQVAQWCEDVGGVLPPPPCYP
jgi:aspartyl-tRNA(Asn)/glutamyl-tRNA(Gln) amidotransferase subunit A